MTQAVCSNEIWNQRINAELIVVLIKSADITNVIKLGLLQWAGHPVRLPKDHTQRNILEDQLYVQQRVRRPRLRWVDEVTDDVPSILGVEIWKATDMTCSK